LAFLKQLPNVVAVQLLGKEISMQSTVSLYSSHLDSATPSTNYSQQYTTAQASSTEIQKGLY